MVNDFINQSPARRSSGNPKRFVPIPTADQETPRESLVRERRLQCGQVVSASQRASGARLANTAFPLDRTLCCKAPMRATLVDASSCSDCMVFDEPAACGDRIRADNWGTSKLCGFIIRIRSIESKRRGTLIRQTDTRRRHENHCLKCGTKADR